MIRQLSISNYVLIDHLEIELGKGLSIFTGETGSGKSIFLGALALAMGDRADSKALLDKSRKCIVELEVDIGGLDLDPVFEENDLDYSDVSILRRQIDPLGRSRAFVNDTPVKLDVLRSISKKVVHIHSQHKNALISSTEFQFTVLDHIAGVNEKRQEYSSLYADRQGLKKHLADLIEREKNALIDEDYYKYQLQELVQADLKANEQEEIEERNATLENADELKALAAIVENESNSVLGPLDELTDRLSRSGRLNTALADLSGRLNSSMLELRDIFSDLENEVSSVEVDPAEKERLNKRLDLIYGLLHKHRVNSIVGLLELAEELEQKVSGIDTLEDEIKNITKKLDQLENDLLSSAKELSEARRSTAPKLGMQIAKKLQELGMPSANFTVELKDRTMPGMFGVDELEFLFSANKGVEERPLGKIASGGELSRTMLVMISMLTNAQGLPAVIFDEIDSGVSGDVAARVGKMMKRMAEDTQVICITHLPQIAGKADAHFKVLREEGKETTRTIIRSLDDEERIEEIATMLSGTSRSVAALDNAKALMREA